ncbi:MAG TPA: aldo/keto reductase [Chloroflexia bacterium]|nr:aldo/keto reductase [Chloroflexia bacterium]
METRKIGSLTVSVVGIGCNNFGGRLDSDGTAAVVQAALDAEINFFDTADIYGKGQSEVLLGRALGSHHDDVVIATKFGHPFEGQGSGASPAYIRAAAEASLRRLGTDHIDLYQLHTPDPNTPIEDTLGAMSDLVREGLVREIGCSNFSLEQLRAAEKAAQSTGVRFVSVQNQLSLIEHSAEQEILPECERTGLAFLPYLPLTGGLLSGKFRQGQPVPEGTRLSGGPRSQELLTPHNFALVEHLIRFAEARGHTILDLAFSWLLSHKPVASVIAGAMTPEQVRANAGTARWQLSDDELAEVGEILSHAD